MSTFDSKERKDPPRPIARRGESQAVEQRRVPPDPGVMALQRTVGNQRVVQLLARGRRGHAPGDPGTVRRIAAEGVAGSGSRLPYLDELEQRFGGHDLHGIQAFTGATARASAEAIGAAAYATDDKIAFAHADPDLHTVAHEVAHIVQQRRGVDVPDGVGAPGDAYERHAHAVADEVVGRRSAAGLLGPAEGRRAATRPVQLLEQPSSKLSELLAMARRRKAKFKRYVQGLANAYRGKAIVGDETILKSTRSARRKLAAEHDVVVPNGQHQYDEYYDDWDASGMLDLLRATITVPTPADLRKLARAIERSEYFPIARTKDRYFGDPKKKDSRAAKSGYRDIQYVIQVPVEDHLADIVADGRNFLAELQINTDYQLRAKEMEHPIYELIRQRHGFSDEEIDGISAALEGSMGKFDQLGSYHAEFMQAIIDRMNAERQNFTVSDDDVELLKQVSLALYAETQEKFARQMRQSSVMNRGRMTSAFGPRDEKRMRSLAPDAVKK